MSGQRGLRVALLGATGVLGGEVIAVLEQRRLPITELRVYASDEGEGTEVEFRGENLLARAVDPDEVAACDLVICAAPGVLPGLLPALDAAGTPLIDASGVLELDPGVPLVGPGQPAASSRVAVPRGIAAGLGWVLGVLVREVELTRATITTLEPASGAGREGIDELMEQTISVLQMSDELPDPRVFPGVLAFDCLPLVGRAAPGADSSGEEELRGVLRRQLHAPALPIELTRVRVPTLSGAMAVVHLGLSHSLEPKRAIELWRDGPGIVICDGDAGLPSPRAAVEAGAVQVGRIRPGREDAPALGFVLALDDIRLGTAAVVVAAAEQMLGGAS